MQAAAHSRKCSASRDALLIKREGDHMGRYVDESRQLEGWFRNRLTNIDPFQMTEEEYLGGVDNLPPHLKQLTTEAFDHWLQHRGYQLSYSQMCGSFFAAVGALKKITLVSRHPVFRLYTAVLIREVTVRGTDDKVFNVPAKITSVRGDDHVITG